MTKHITKGGHYFAGFGKCQACEMTYAHFRDSGEPQCKGRKAGDGKKEPQPIPD
jgi:hypothetical protein